MPRFGRGVGGCYNNIDILIYTVLLILINFINPTLINLFELIMETQYTWKTKLFSNRFEIYSYDKIAGEIKKEGWSRRVSGELNARKIVFETRGFFNYKTQIINTENNAEIGQINYQKWRAKSTIICDDKKYYWQFNNFFRTKWTLSNENGILVKYHSRGFKGFIISYSKDEILILTGFFIRNFMNQRSAEIAAVS